MSRIALLVTQNISDFKRNADDIHPVYVKILSNLTVWLFLNNELSSFKFSN